MKTTWHKSRRKNIDLQCPVCGHQTAPPEYPYCSHVLFVYVDPASGDAAFDYMRTDFAAAMQEAGAEKPSRKILAALNGDGLCDVWDVSESVGYYPTRVIAGFELAPPGK